MIPLEEREGTFEVIKALIKHSDCYELDTSIVSVVNVPLGNMMKMSEEDFNTTLTVAQLLAFERVMLVEATASQNYKIMKSSNAFFDVAKSQFEKGIDLSNCYLSIHVSISPFEQHGVNAANIFCAAFIFEKPFKMHVAIVPDQYFINKVSKTPHIRLC